MKWYYSQIEIGHIESEKKVTQAASRVQLL